MKNKELRKIKLSANILFSGLGMQEYGWMNSGLFDMDILATSDIDKDAIVQYASIHNGLNKELVESYDYPSKEEMIEDLTRMNIGFEPNTGKATDWNKLAKKKDKMKGIEIYWLACKLSKQMGDISKIEKLPYADFWTISFPCQSISVAGKMKGLTPDSGTRSSLLWENIRLLKESIECGESPKYLMFENVKNLVSKKFINDFNDLLSVLDELGFNSYWKVLNGCECGIPQNRQRVFVISIRKDIDTGKMDFPIPFDNGLRLKHLLQPVEEIDEKYYINTDRASDLIRQLVEKGQLKGNRECCDSTINDPNVRDKSNCITARYDAGIQNQKQIGMAVAEPISNRLGGMFDDNTKHQAGSVWDSEGLAPTLDTMQGGLRQPCVVTDNKLKELGNLWEDNGYNSQAGRIYDSENLCPSINAGGTTRMPLTVTEDTNRINRLDGLYGQASGYVSDVANMYRIRKLTPIETGLLMGLTRQDVENCIANGVANSSLYKAHGNGIITNCCELLAEHLYKAQYDNDFVCTDEKIVNFLNPQG